MTPATEASLAGLANRLRQGDRRALARAITCLESGGQPAHDLLASLYPYGGHAHVVGVTGAPGTGKSTLVSALALACRRRGLTAGILAIDPTSPFSGGALLGDRLRMRDLAGDPGIFIRSMATRGSTGGLSRVTADAVHALDAAAYDRIFIETVGAGQDEVEVARLAHTVIVVEAPGLGDDIQAIKAGILETANILVVNKADREGAEQALASLRMMLELHSGAPATVSHHGVTMAVAPAPAPAGPAPAPAGPAPAPAGPGPAPAGGWRPPLLATVATEGRGVDEVVDAIEAHRAHLAAGPAGAELDRWRAELQLGHALDEELRCLLARTLDPAIYRQALQEVIERRSDPHSAAARLVGSLGGEPAAGSGHTRRAATETMLHLAENDASRARLRALVSRLSGSDLQRTVAHGWTVSATLAHLAYWDRRNLATLEEWERSGVRVSPVDPDPINEAMLPQWLAMPPREAVAEVLAAAEAVDGKVRRLEPVLVEDILARRPRSVDRAIHRREHLQQIERALAL